MHALLKEAPIFVFGAGRSGTTLLRSLLSAHPRIAVTPETHFMKQAARFGDLTTGQIYDVNTFWAKYRSLTRFRDLDVDADRCRRLMDEAAGDGPITLKIMFEAVLAAYLEQAGKARVGEKSPSHVHYARPLLDWWPDARAVIIRRDPRAVVASQLKSPWVAERLSRASLSTGYLVGSRRAEVARYAGDWAQHLRHPRPRAR